MSFKLILLLLVTLECFLGVGYIIYKSGKDKPLSVKVIATFIFILGLVFLETFVVNFVGQDSNNPLVVLFSYLFFVLCLTLPPTYYLYVLSLVKKKEEIVSKYKLQLFYIPAIFLLSINLFSFFALNNMGPDNANFTMVNQVLRYSNFVALFFVFLIQNVYFIYNSWLIYFEQRAIVNEAKGTDTALTLKWLFSFITLYTIIIVLLYVFQLSPLLPGKIIFRIFTILYIGLLIYFGSNNYQFSNENNYLQNLNSEKINEFKLKLTNMMENDAIYLDQDLSLTKLSQLVGTNSKYLSYLINQEFDSNFSSFVNSYRIEHAKKLLRDPDNDIYTIKTIAEMTGFKSKSSFNSAFKKITETTPSLYKNSM